MLTDTKLRNLKPVERPYKLSDRDGLYPLVQLKACESRMADLMLPQTSATRG